VKLLNGGRKKWELRVASSPRTLPRSRRRLRVSGGAGRDPRALRDEVLAKLGSASFVDVRSGEEYRGREASRPTTFPRSRPRCRVTSRAAATSRG